MLRVALLICGVFACSVYANYPQNRTWLDPEFVERAFVDVALKREYNSGNWQLVKWNQPIKIWVNHQVGDQELHDLLTSAHLTHLSQLTGVPITRVNTRSQANVIWIFTRESQWRKEVEKELGKSALNNMHGAICKAGYRLDSRSGAITSAAIIIPVDQARNHGKLLACIVEEVTQVMGLPNDAESAFPSIFNDETPEDLLSPLDVVLLQLLYEPELTVGMNAEQVRPIVRKILRRYQKQGVLDKAVATANSGELYQLVGN
ncbi:hypothetical protein SE23_13795 [Vibrio sinaloensis]|uniref:DUF2927 domain-containing protein n=1 Tax=Photobacterium sp. (strain ATCC 43367) TaxID=379097 RepID=UPI00057CCAAF|nr:DUF2927 domain-containing protein [Vibrio sinaloensis]KIE20012.1 hypothetical protein SE23_13795 [Vibrio sinaloensis]